MSDSDVRGAARTATLVALPVAAAVGAGVFLTLRPDAGRADDRPPLAASASAAAPVPDTPVPVAAPRLTGRAAAVCADLVAQLPADLRGLARRTVAGGARQNAAYGEPPVTLACGTAGATFPATTQLLRLDGVCWYGRTTAAGSVWTTVDRQVPVTVTVPPPAAGAAQRVIDFSPAVVGAVPGHPDPPSGCRLQAVPSPLPQPTPTP